MLINLEEIDDPQRVREANRDSLELEFPEVKHILKTRLTISVYCFKQKDVERSVVLEHKRHKNFSDNIIFVLWWLGKALLSFRFVHFRGLAVPTLITRYREYFNILSQERIRKRRRMDHYVTYSKSYYTGRYQKKQGCILYHYL